MADTITTYIGNGTQTDFSIPFDYLKKSFVRVYVDSVLLTGGDYGDTTADYYFLDKTTVRLKTPPAENIEVTIRRYTSATERIVSFEDASILKATDLDTSQLQTFHIAEEARDIINDALVKDPDGNWDALGNRITNVGDPVDGGDAINLDWYNEGAGSVQANADLTEQWKNETKGYRDEAEGFRNDSERYASQAKTFADSTAGFASDIEETITQAKQDISTAVTQGVSQVSSTGSTAVSNINDAKDQATENLETVTQGHLSEITSAGSTQVQAVNTAGTTQISAVNKAGTDNISKVTTEGNNQKAAVASEGTKQVGLVTTEGTKQTSLVTTEGTKQTSLVTTEGTKQVAIIKTHIDKAQQWAEKTDGEVEAGKYSAKYWAQQASIGQLQSDWNQTDDSAKDFIKNKPVLGALASKNTLDYSEITGTPPTPDLSSYATLAAPALTGNATLDGFPIATEADIPVLTSGTTDLEAGTSPLATGTYYFVYE